MMVGSLGTSVAASSKYFRKSFRHKALLVIDPARPLRSRCPVCSSRALWIMFIASSSLYTLLRIGVPDIVQQHLACSLSGSRIRRIWSMPLFLSPFLSSTTPIRKISSTFFRPPSAPAQGSSSSSRNPSGSRKVRRASDRARLFLFRSEWPFRDLDRLLGSSLIFQDEGDVDSAIPVYSEPVLIFWKCSSAFSCSPFSS